MNKKKTVLITGASRGLGMALAHEAAKKNYNLCLVARCEEALAKVAITLKDNYAVHVETVVADVSDYEALKSKLMPAIGTMPPLYGVINNAAIACFTGKMTDSTIKEWRECLNTNLMGSVNVCHMLLPILKKHKHGKIINVCGGGVGWKNLSGDMSAYITSKFALYGFTETLANALEGCSIDVNALSPGSMDTALRQEIVSKSSVSCSEEDLTPDSAVKMAMFLLSKESDGIRGRIISAKWDTIEALNKLKSTTAYQYDNALRLRKIDGRNFDGFE